MRKTMTLIWRTDSRHGARLSSYKRADMRLTVTRAHLPLIDRHLQVAMAPAFLASTAFVFRRSRSDRPIHQWQSPSHSRTTPLADVVAFPTNRLHRIRQENP